MRLLICWLWRGSRCHSVHPRWTGKLHSRGKRGHWRGYSEPVCSLATRLPEAAPDSAALSAPASVSTSTCEWSALTSVNSTADAAGETSALLPASGSVLGAYPLAVSVPFRWRDTTGSVDPLYAPASSASCVSVCSSTEPYCGLARSSPAMQLLQNSPCVISVFRLLTPPTRGRQQMLKHLVVAGRQHSPRATFLLRLFTSVAEGSGRSGSKTNIQWLAPWPRDRRPRTNVMQPRTHRASAVRERLLSP